MVAWENEVVMRDVTNAGLVISDHIGREIAGQLDLEEALEASRYSSHPYSTHPREFIGIGESMAMERQIWRERIRMVDEI
ncbi:hypothetical protein OROMI_009843 [Orobanche minor]